MDLKYLTTGEVERRLVLHWSRESFCAKFECSSNALDNRLHKLYPKSQAFRRVTQDMKSNRKFPQPDFTKPESEAVIRPLTKPVEVRAPDTAAPNALDEPMLDSATPPKPLPVQPPVKNEPSMTLAECETLRDSLSQKIQELENRAIEINRSRPKEALTEACEKIFTIHRELHELLRNFDNLRDEDEAKRAEVREVNEKKSALQSQKDEVVKLIARLKVICYLVFNDGTIAPAEENPDAPVDDSGWETLFAQLVQLPRCQDLNLGLRDVRTLARVIALVQNNPNKTVDLTFDNDTLRQIYEENKEGFNNALQ